MRGGNRQRLAARPGARVPPPPRALEECQRVLWAELARAVETLGTYRPSDLAAFRAMVRGVARAERCPLDAPPSAAARLEQAAKSALESFGLTPAARERLNVTTADDSAEAARLKGLLDP